MPALKSEAVDPQQNYHQALDTEGIPRGTFSSHGSEVKTTRASARFWGFGYANVRTAEASVKANGKAATILVESYRQ